ncbi:MAG: 6-bladed beta-propeller [Tannerellaceae bacterium]
MKQRYVLFFIFCSFIGFAQEKPIEIKIDLEKMEMSDAGLNEFVESIEYIPLETTDDCVIGDRIMFDTDETHIIVRDQYCKTVYLFDRKGRFIRTIGRLGQGPEEYIDIRNLFLDSGNVIVISKNKASFFDKQGKFVKAIALPIDEKSVVASYDNKFLRMVPSYYFRDSTFNVYSINNDKGEILKEAVRSVAFPLKKDPEWRISYCDKLIIPLYTYQNRPHIREYLNDTVYMVSRSNEFIPKYTLNLGKYKVTPEIQADIKNYADRIVDKVIIHDMIEQSDRLLIEYFHQWKFRCVFYDKKSGKLYKFPTTGYPNNYDGGLDFSARIYLGQKNKEARTVFTAYEFLEILEKNKERKIKAKGPQSAIKAFNRLAAKVDPEDNPILMILHLKE